MATTSDDREAIVGELGAQICELRERRGVSLRELQRRTGINAWQLAALERGQRDAQISTVARVVGALGSRIAFEDVR